MTRPHACRTSNSAALAAVVCTCLIGCDRDEPKAAPPPQAAAVPDPYDRYAAAVTPLVAELTKMKELLLTREGTKAAPFEHQFSAIRTELAKVEPTLTAEDKDRESWKAASAAVAGLKAQQTGMAKLQEVITRAEELQRARDLGVSLKVPPGRLVQDQKTLLELPDQLANVAATAGGDISRCESAIAARR